MTTDLDHAHWLAQYAAVLTDAQDAARLLAIAQLVRERAMACHVAARECGETADFMERRREFYATLDGAEAKAAVNQMELHAAVLRGTARRLTGGSAG